MERLSLRSRLFPCRWMILIYVSFYGTQESYINVCIMMEVVIVENKCSYYVPEKANKSNNMIQ